MNPSIEKIVGLLKNPQAADRSLWETGAYPQKDESGAWRMQSERVIQFTDSYFARTNELTGNGALDFAALPNFRLTNETGYPRVLSRIRNIGGAYMGVGAALGAVFASEMSASYAFMVDCNAGMPYGFIPLYGALLAMAPTRAHFASLVVGHPLSHETISGLYAASGIDIIDAAQDQFSDKSFRQTVEDAIRTVIGTSSQNESAVKSAMEWFLAMRGGITELYKLNREDGSGNGGPLVSEGNYQRHRELFLSGRVTGMATDMSAKNLMLIRSALSAMGVPLSLLYVSNVEAWLSVEKGDLYSFYENLRQLASRWNPLVISSLHVQRPTVFDLASYLARAIPFGLPQKDAARVAEEFRVLRYYIMWGKNLSLTTEDILSNLQKRNPVSEINTLMTDVASVYNGSPLGWHEFEEKMLEKSEIYRKFRVPVRELFILNMMDAGIIEPPYPLLYGNGALSVVSRNSHEIIQRAGNSGSGGLHRGPVFFKPEPYQSVPAGFSGSGAGSPLIAGGNMMLGGAFVSGAGLLPAAAPLMI